MHLTIMDFKNAAAITSSLFILTSCNIGVKVKNVPTKYEAQSESKVVFSPDFKKILEYCTGKIDHDISTEKLENPDFTILPEQRQYEIDDCYYNFDFTLPDSLDET